MKKKYENDSLIFALSFLSIITFIILIILSMRKDYKKYVSIPANHIADNIVEVVLTTKELKYLQKNKYVFNDSKKIKIEIISITKQAYKNTKRCHLVVLKLKLKKGQTNVIYISIYDKREKYIKLLKQFWKE